MPWFTAKSTVPLPSMSIEDASGVTLVAAAATRVVSVARSKRALAASTLAWARTPGSLTHRLSGLVVPPSTLAMPARLGTMKPAVRMSDWMNSITRRASCCASRMRSCLT